MSSAAQDVIAQVTEAMEVLDSLTEAGKYCGLGVCTGARVNIPLVGEVVPYPVLEVPACLFCLDDIIAAFPGRPDANSALRVTL